MANIYEAYQNYLNNIGEYVPSASDVYSGVSGLTSRIPQVARDVLLPSGDDGNQGPPGPPGTGGIADLLDKYNDLGFIGRGAVNTGIGLAFPQAAGLLGMYNVGKGIYDVGRDLLGYNDPRDPYGGLIDFNKQPEFRGSDATGYYGGFEVTEEDALGMGYGNVRGPGEDLSLIEQREDEGRDSNGGTGSGANEGGSGADSGSGTHDDPGD